MRLNWPLLASAARAFGIDTAEFAPMGLLPVIAAGLGVFIPQAGLLVTGSAAMFTVLTYIAPILRGVTHALQNMLMVTLAIYGVDLTVGNALGGYFADRVLTPTLPCARHTGLAAAVRVEHA